MFKEDNVVGEGDRWGKKKKKMRTMPGCDCRTSERTSDLLRRGFDNDEDGNSDGVSNDEEVDEELRKLELELEEEKAKLLRLTHGGGKM